ALGVVHRRRIEGAHRRSLGLEEVDDLEGWRVAQIVGVGLEREPENPHDLAVEPPEDAAELLDDRAADVAVDLHHGTEKLWVRAVDRRHVFESPNVLRKTGAAVAEARVEEAPADAAVVAHSLGHLGDV